MTMTPEQMKKIYNETLADVNLQIEELRKRLAKHSRGGVHMGHVGDLQEVCTRLSEILPD